MNEVSRPHWFNWIVYTAIGWNVIGLLQFIAHISVSAEQLAEMSFEQQQLIATMPDWVNVAFAMAVIFGVLGSVALLLKKALALQLFLISMLGILMQNYYSFFMSDALDVMGPVAVAIPVIVITISVLLIWFSFSAKSKGWID